MDIGIIGLGSVGLFTAASLSNKHQVTGYVRNHDQLSLIKSNGILINQKQFYIDIKLTSDLHSHDLIIVCVKQTQLKEVIDGLPFVKPSTVMFLQNGLGHLDMAKELNHDILLGICEHGVRKTNSNQVKLNGLGQIRVGSMTNPPLAQSIESQLNEDYFPVVFDEKIMVTIQEKLVVNSVINPITALFEVNNGEILENPYLRDLAQKLSEEAASVFGFNQLKCWEKVQQVANNTKRNVSSMLVDLQSNRQTELDFINGYLIEHTTKTLPNHEYLFQLIKAKEYQCMRR